MKTIITNILLAIMLMMTSINAQAQKNPFDKFSDYEDVTYIFISEAMLKLVGTTAIPSIDGIDINEIGSKLKSIQIITSEKCTKNSLKSEAMSIIKKESYEKLIQVSEKDNKVDIYLKVQEGKKYYFRNITWVGNTVYPSPVLSAALGIKKGDVYNQKLLQEKLLMDEDAVSSLYLDNGYLFFNVDPVEVNIEGDSIDMEMRIYEGRQAVINEVIINGNTAVYEHVIRRELRTKPGQLFSRSDLQRSARELAQTVI